MSDCYCYDTEMIENMNMLDNWYASKNVKSSENWDFPPSIKYNMVQDGKVNIPTQKSYLSSIVGNPKITNLRPPYKQQICDVLHPFNNQCENNNKSSVNNIYKIIIALIVAVLLFRFIF